jgi:hypothetical protein
MSGKSCTGEELNASNPATDNSVNKIIAGIGFLIENAEKFTIL